MSQFTYTSGLKTSYITGATTTQIVTGNARLVSITINKTTTGTITIIDGTTGTTATLAVIAIGAVPQTLWYNAMFAKGIRIINSATEDFTAAYIDDSK